MWYHFAVTPISLPNHFDLASMSLWFGLVSLIGCHFDITSMSLRSYFGLTSISPRSHFGSTLMSRRCRSDFTSMSLRCNLDFSLISLRPHFDPISFAHFVHNKAVFSDHLWYGRYVWEDVCVNLLFHKVHLLYISFCNVPCLLEECWSRKLYFRR